MRWPWQRKPEPAPIAEAIEEQTVKHLKVLQRARLAERRIVDDYARADLERRK